MKSENVIFKRSLKFRPVLSGPDRGKYVKIMHLQKGIGGPACDRMSQTMSKDVQTANTTSSTIRQDKHH